MALPISNIPILTGAAAKSFVRNAKVAERNRGSIDFPDSMQNGKVLMCVMQNELLS